MLRPIAILILGAALGFGEHAAAQESDDDEDWDDIDLLLDDDEEQPDEDAPDIPDWEDEDLLDDDEDDALENFEDAEDGDDLLFDDEEQGPQIVEQGQDSPSLYRDAREEFSELPSDEEVMAWERYLSDYPRSLYVETIQRRIQDLMAEQYDDAVGRVEESRVDAARLEILLESPMLLENINPRGRLHVAFEFGFPGWANLNLDFEHRFLRELSAHVGIGRRATGYGVEVGPRWAMVKSTRFQTIVTLFADARLNFDPVYFSVRPYLGAARIFGPVQIQGQVGVDIEARARGGVRLLGGLRVSYRLAQTIGIYLEGHGQMKNLGWEGGPFSFYVASFGVKLFPSFKARSYDPIEIGAGAAAPFYTNYWQYHFGSAIASLDYYTTK